MTIVTNITFVDKIVVVFTLVVVPTGVDTVVSIYNVFVRPDIIDIIIFVIYTNNFLKRYWTRWIIKQGWW